MIDGESNMDYSVEQIVEENHVDENLSDKLVKDFGEFDPTLELSNYKFPTLNLLRDYNESISVDQEELEAHKNKIVEISSATITPRSSVNYGHLIETLDTLRGNNIINIGVLSAKGQ